MTGQDLKNSILQLAIQGKLVPQDANDEPASVLLERIKAEKQKLIKEKKIKKEKPLPEITEEEKPFEIPESWEWCRLGEIFQTSSGSTPLTSNPLYYGGNINWTRTTDLNNGALYQCEKKITEKALEECNLNIIPRDSVCVAMYGGAGTIGKYSIIKFDTTINQSVCAIYPNGLCSMNFVLHFMQYQRPNWMNFAAGSRKDPNINKIIINNCIFPLPPLSEQHRIVAKIEELMPLVEEYDKAQKELDALNAKLPEALRKSILQEAIQGKLVPQDPNDEPASVLLQRIRKEKEQLVKDGKLKKKDLVTTPISDEEKPFEIPESWEWCRLGEIVSNRAGLAYNKENLDKKVPSMIRVLRGGNISYGSWHTEDNDIMIAPEYVNEELLLRKGTFITPAVTSLENMGKTALIEEDLDDTVVGGFVLMLKSFYEDITLCKYVLNFFGTLYYKEYCKSITNKSGQAFYNISRTKLMSCLIPLPPLSEQHRIVSKIEDLFAQIEPLAKALSTPM